MTTDRFGELIEIVCYVKRMHDEASMRWERERNGELPYNLKRLEVRNIGKEEEFMRYVKDYLDFCNSFSLEFDMGAPEGIARSRVKHINSIQQKIEAYISNKDDGKYPTIKVLNDLFGVRYIHEGVWSFSDISEQLRQNGLELKCIDSSKNGYRGVHIYFHRDNRTFQWELQIWDLADRDNNIESHKKYKQGYSNWESIQEGGDLQ